MLCSLESRAVTHRRIRSAGRLLAHPQAPLELSPPDGTIAARVERLHPGNVRRNAAVERAQTLRRDSRRLAPMAERSSKLAHEQAFRADVSAHDSSDPSVLEANTKGWHGIG
eukprot:COSAG04_NODE_17890_length_456_cov_1.417367_1_plen_112_part_00